MKRSKQKAAVLRLLLFVAGSLLLTLLITGCTKGKAPIPDHGTGNSSQMQGSESEGPLSSALDPSDAVSSPPSAGSSGASEEISGSEDGRIPPVDGGKMLPMMLYSEETPFEHWTSGTGKHYYQLCVMFNKEALDATGKLGEEYDPFSYRLYCRPAGSTGGWTSIDTPVETFYAFDDGNVIYRLQTQALMEHLTVGESYETVVEVRKDGETAGWGSLTVRYTEGSAKDLQDYLDAVKE